GLRIELGEVEFALRQQNGVTDALVVLRDERLIGYVLCREAAQREGFVSTDWRKGLQGFLPEYMIPHQLVALEEWPLTVNGKVDRAALPDPQKSNKPQFVAPRNAIEEQLAEIWRDVLGSEKISVHDDFFALGGHSLLAVRAASKFRKTFKVDIPLRALFDLHTIAQISEYIETLLWAVESAEKSKENDAIAGGRVEGLL
ncbi:MAG: hypothetical protein JKY67_14900, partial [Pseudomonadales bacterium]|nr:hypothetical protein [Pseudomonadales bacterium]